MEWLQPGVCVPKTLAKEASSWEGPARLGWPAWWEGGCCWGKWDLAWLEELHKAGLMLPLLAEACGPDATCVNRATGQGYVCRCLLGKHGERCMAGECGGRGGGEQPGVCGHVESQLSHHHRVLTTTGATVTTPYFHGADAFISYPSLTNIHYELRVDLEIKPLSPDGLILFSGGNGGPGADFVSLSMAAGHLEFRYELGSGENGPAAQIWQASPHPVPPSPRDCLQLPPWQKHSGLAPAAILQRGHFERLSWGTSKMLPHGE